MFNEQLSIRWYIGAALMVIGVVMLASSRGEEEKIRARQKDAEIELSEIKTVQEGSHFIP